MAAEAPIEADQASLYPEVGDIINQNYQVTRRIGAGSFGAIFEVQNVQDGKMYAVKLEKLNTPSPQLSYEHKLYTILDAATAFPRVYDFWQDTKFRGMVMDRLGCSLGYYCRKCGKILSMKTVLMCAIQMLCRLEYLHQRSFIHRDIKPDNFVFGVGNNANLLYMIDLGLAKKYRDLRTHQHENYSEDRGLAGTARYVSINVHLGVEQSCRDDLESVGYVIISLVKGKLPWQGMEACSKGEKYEIMSQAKLDTPLEVLCEGLPNEFLLYMQRVRNLRFDEKPVYSQLRSLFVNLMIKLNYVFDFKYDWAVSRAQRLDGALRGKADPNKVLIPVSPQDVMIGSAETNNKKNINNNNSNSNNGYLQPLPFFSVVHEAARFIRMSKKKSHQQHNEMMKDDTNDENDENNTNDEANNMNELPRQQTMFILDPRHTQLPVVPLTTDFETEKAKSPSPQKASH